MRRSLAVIATGILLLVSGTFPLRAEERETLSDFEKPGLADQFIAVRQIELAREPLVAMAPEGGPAGQALSARTDGNAAVFSKAGAVKGSLLNASDVELWVYRSAKEQERGGSEVEIQFLEADTKARFWRKIDLDHVGWRKFSLPLRWFQWGEGRIPRWDHIDRWGLLFRDHADVQIDDVKLVRQEDPDIALPQADDLRRLAFPDAEEKDVRVVQRGDLLLATDAPDLEIDKLVGHLNAVKMQLSADLSLPPAPPWPVPVMIFRTRGEYEAFPPRLAAKLNGRGVAPRSTGFTIQGIATSYWDDNFDTLRPVYTHEFVHALLSREVSLANRSDWFQEGLAVVYQLKFHPQDDFPQIVAKGMSDPSLRMPLRDLASGKPIPQARYWQAATLVEMLLKDKKYQPQFAALLRGFAESGSTDLTFQLDKLYQANWDDLTRDWRRFCDENYRAK